MEVFLPMDRAMDLLDTQDQFMVQDMEVDIQLVVNTLAMVPHTVLEQDMVSQATNQVMDMEVDRVDMEIKVEVMEVIKEEDMDPKEMEEISPGNEII